MKYIIILIFVLSVNTVFGAEVDLEWKQSASADGYKIETSVDLGATWAEVPNLVFTTFTEGTMNLVKATITVADNVLVLGRVGAFNTVGTSWKLESGIFYNSAWKPLPAPTGLGAN